MVFRKDGTVHPGPRNDFGLWGRTGGSATNIVLSTDFIEFSGTWRIGDVDGIHMSLSHKDGKTAMIWRSDGTQHAGPRSDFSTWSKAPQGALSHGNKFVQLGKAWRVGDVDGATVFLLCQYVL